MNDMARTAVRATVERIGKVPRYNNTAGVRERSEWSGGASDIEGKTTRVGASECGQRTSFNRTREAGNRDEVEGVVANTLNLHRNGAACRVSAFTLVGFIVLVRLDARQLREASSACMRLQWK
jgi:hypothetical protein